MNTLKIQDELYLSDETEARREHERYQCHGIGIKFNRLDNHQPLAANEIQTASVNDISLNGLSIKLSQSLTVGDLLSIEILNPNNDENETLMTVIMWCNASNSKAFNAGLKVICSEDFNQDTTHSIKVTDRHQNQLICPSCNEVSFYLKEIDSDKTKPQLHHCCRCGHSHQITHVMAFNRQLKD